MNAVLITTFALALREIRRHLMRSFLTVLGIVIGVGSVVTMVTLGNGTTAAVQQQISSLGANILQIRPGQGFGRGGGGGSQPQPFEADDIEALRQQVAGLVSVAPLVQSSGLAVRNAANWSTTIYGTSNDYLKAQSWSVDAGRTFTVAEEQAGKTVCLIGSTVRRNLFRDENPVGASIRIRDLSCQVVGALAARGSSMGPMDQDDVVIMPVKAAQRRITGNQHVSMIMVSVDPAYDSKTVQASIKSLLRERRHLQPADADDFNIFDTQQISETLRSTTQMLTGLLGAVAAVSLLVGGIGIMNIMLVSVTERTREIGVRLAIGALGREVLLQFLVEAVVLSSLGGLLGLTLALCASLILAPMLNVPYIFDPTINTVAFVFSALIGVLFGYFPARRAARLNPMDALRHE
ncbi:ABC transporter permease [Caulobacter sp. 602-1]|uniref:ABC transporter permease n=1 Tax=Caulobacter sp. 602-1 TaxID=2492472 RepID=UPI000F63C869|nr:ABC transporter permease [Caulobacter sp. 602-1]RRN64304.1 FtsX-like permease family protein [Caulobacter sp. 602-1]